MDYFNSFDFIHVEIAFYFLFYSAFIRASDCITWKARLKCKARRSFFSSQGRPIDFVIFVVNGLSVLESLNSADEEKKKEYSQMIATNFNNPWLSFKGTSCETSF